MKFGISLLFLVLSASSTFAQERGSAHLYSSAELGPRMLIDPHQTELEYEIVQDSLEPGSPLTFQAFTKLTSDKDVISRIKREKAMDHELTVHEWRMAKKENVYLQLIGQQDQDGVKLQRTRIPLSYTRTELESVVARFNESEWYCGDSAYFFSPDGFSLRKSYDFSHTTNEVRYMMHVYEGSLDKYNFSDISNWLITNWNYSAVYIDANGRKYPHKGDLVEYKTGRASYLPMEQLLPSEWEALDAKKEAGPYEVGSREEKRTYNIGQRWFKLPENGVLKLKLVEEDGVTSNDLIGEIELPFGSQSSFADLEWTPGKTHLFSRLIGDKDRREPLHIEFIEPQQARYTVAMKNAQVSFTIYRFCKPSE